MTCYNCNVPFTTENSSEEHILPQGIGGRLTSTELLCRNCNSKYGSTIDKDLSKQFESFVALLRLKRQRSKELPILKNLISPSGKLFTLKDGRFPEPVHSPVTKTANGYSINARNEEEFQAILKGFKKKYPGSDFMEMENKVERSSSYMEEPIQIQMNVGGDSLLKAVGKIALNYYLSKHGDRKYVTPLLDFINGNLNNDEYVHHHLIEPSISWNPREVSHTICLQGNPDTHTLVAYIILFSSASYIVNLSETYAGPSCSYTYCYDVMTHQEVDKEVSFFYPGRTAYKTAILTTKVKDEMAQAIRSSLKSATSRILGLVELFQYEDKIEETGVEAIIEVLGPNFDEEEISNESVNKILAVFNQKIGPFLIHFFNKHKKLSNRSSQ
ncbi:HNH endonuclease [Chitinophaga sp. S165]|nr:HNH endonuclease [Chitinophaga sp. S165]